MADVFISYKREERERVVPLADRLRELKLDVWFDANLHTGFDFTEEIVEELKTAKSIFVCWSPASTKSKWVRSEARVGLDQETIVPCFIERVSLWPPFNNLQVEDLTDWRGHFDHPGFLKVAHRIGELVKRPGLPTLCTAHADPTGSKLAIWASTFPDDPAVESVWPIWERKQRDDFAGELERVRVSLEKRSKRRQARIKSKLAALERDFDAWLSSRAGVVDHRRPDPRALLVSDEAPDSAEVAEVADVPLIADTPVNDDSIDSPVVVAATALADEPPSTSLVPVASAPPPSRRLPLAASLVLGLILGGGIGWFTAKPSKPADMASGQNATKVTQLEGRLTSATAEASSAKEAQVKAERELADARKQVDDLTAFKQNAAALKGSLDAKLQQATAALSFAEARRQTAEDGLAQAKTQFGVLTQQLKDSRADTDKARANADKLEARLAPLDATVAENATNVLQLKDRLAAAAADVSAAKDARDQAERELGEARKQVGGLTASARSAGDVKESLEEKLRQANTALSTAEGQRQTAESRLSDAAGQIKSLTQQVQDALSEITALNARLALAQPARGRETPAAFETAPTAPQETPDSRPRRGDSEAAMSCTASAGSPFDPDNRSKQGPTDILKLDLATIQEAIASCRAAVKEATSTTIKRQLLAQLGRAEVASAVLRKRGDDDSGASGDMRNAKSTLEEARGLGSSYATAQLANFYMGRDNSDASATDFFVTADRSRAIRLYGEAAQQGNNAAAMTQLALLKLDEKQQQDFDPGAIRWLKRAEALGYSKAAYFLAQAYLSPQVLPGTTEDERNLKAATVLAEASCHGIPTVDIDRYFAKANKLAKYRPSSVSCN